MNNTFMKISKH